MLGQPWPVSTKSAVISARFWLCSTNIGRFRQNLPSLAMLHQIWRFRQNLPFSTKLISAQFGPRSAKCDRCPPISANFDQLRAGSGRVCPCSDQTCARFGHVRASVGQTRAVFDQLLAGFSKMCVLLLVCTSFSVGRFVFGQEPCSLFTLRFLADVGTCGTSSRPNPSPELQTSRRLRATHRSTLSRGLPEIIPHPPQDVGGGGAGEL